MALGAPGIAAARQELGNIGTAVNAARESNEHFRNLYKDENFQKFVSQTSKGSVINDQLAQLAKWIDSMCSLIDRMKTDSEKYLTEQEAINNSQQGG